MNVRSEMHRGLRRTGGSTIDAMRRALLTLTLVAAALCATSGQALAASTYCSPSGDYCYSAKRVAGVVQLRFDTFSFSDPVKTCVRAPAGSRVCRTFALTKRKAGLMGFTKRWSAHFPRRGKGTYRVTFEVFGSTIGPGVTFKL